MTQRHPLPAPGTTEFETIIEELCLIWHRPKVAPQVKAARTRRNARNGDCPVQLRQARAEYRRSLLEVIQGGRT